MYNQLLAKLNSDSNPEIAAPGEYASRATLKALNSRMLTEEDVLENQDIYNLFMEYLKSRYCSENLVALRGIQALKDATFEGNNALAQEFAWLVYL